MPVQSRDDVQSSAHSAGLNGERVAGADRARRIVRKQSISSQVCLR